MRQQFSRTVDRVIGGTDVVPIAVKVPLEISALFWAIKITSTAMGEALADWLDGSPNTLIAGVGSLLAAVMFVVALRWQFRTDKYKTQTYWFTVAMVATFGTMAADSLHQFLGLPYWSTVIFYAIVLALVFWRWWANERNLSIHSINTRRREKFYWGTVAATFALGTATGDWTATDLKLGFWKSGVIFAGLIIVPLIAYLLGANSIATFWTAYVLTRPLGASFADWLDYPKKLGGLLGDGTYPVWITFAVIMLVLVVILSRRERTLGIEHSDAVSEEFAHLHGTSVQHRHHAHPEHAESVGRRETDPA